MQRQPGLNRLMLRQLFIRVAMPSCCQQKLRSGDTLPPLWRFLDDADKENVDAFGATFAYIRETMMRNEWHPGCYKCKADEETKGSSMRTEADEFFDDFTDSVELQYLEITVGRLCNLKCMSCGLNAKWPCP